MMTFCHSGYEFEPWKESDALFAAESAPEWVDAENCYRCRVAFGVVTRKVSIRNLLFSWSQLIEIPFQHHCRNCGQIFCDKCSSKTAPIPKYGIERDVRVCEICHDKLKRSVIVFCLPAHHIFYHNHYFSSPKAPPALVTTVTPGSKMGVTDSSAPKLVKTKVIFL